ADVSGIAVHPFSSSENLRHEHPLRSNDGLSPIVFMLAALPITLAHLGTTQAAWIFFFRQYAAGSHLLAFSLVAHLAFSLTRGLLGLVFFPRVYKALLEPLRPARLLTTSPPPPLHSANP